MLGVGIVCFDLFCLFGVYWLACFVDLWDFVLCFYAGSYLCMGWFVLCLGVCPLICTWLGGFGFMATLVILFALLVCLVWVDFDLVFLFFGCVVDEGRCLSYGWRSW